MPCSAAPTDTGFCHLHNDPTLAAKLGRVGGRKNRHVTPDAPRVMPAIDTMAGVQQFITQLVGAVYTEKLPVRTVSGINSLLNTMIRTFDPSDVEKRLQQLEAAEAKRRQMNSDSSN
jgi:hypothetical protein